MMSCAVDPICARQAPWRVSVHGARGQLAEAKLVITTTGNKDVVKAAHLAGMRDQAIVGNVGRRDDETDMADDMYVLPELLDEKVARAQDPLVA